MKKSGKMFIMLLVISSISLLVACGGSGGGGGDGSAGGTPATTGSVSLSLTDATTPDYLAVYITVKEVWVSKSADDDADDDAAVWTVVAEPNTTYNLLELVNGVIAHLGLTELEPGDYNQMRLIIGKVPDDHPNLMGEPHPFANYFIRGDDDVYEYVELFIPSGYQTGFKIVGGFTVSPDQNTDLVLDFNVAKSIVQAGASGKWLLKPTVKVLEQDSSASITGLVYAEDGNATIPLEGALVSAQTNTDKDQAEIVKAATITDEQGQYKLLLEAGTYQVVALMQGYGTMSEQVTVPAGGTVEQDFLMAPVTNTGTIYGCVDIVNGTDDQYVTINILQQVDGETVQVATKSVANGGNYWFDLPAGVYSMTAIFMMNGEQMTLEVDDEFEISDGIAIKFDIVFENVDDDDNDDGDDDGDDDDGDDDGDDGSEKPEKITICHKGRTITISTSALQAHLNHGDTIGPCGSDEGDDDGGSDADTTDNVTICHKGRQLTVSQSALEAHLRHGDTIGPCDDPDTSDDHINP